MVFSRRSSHKLGLSPGSLVYIGEPKEAPVHISIMDYDETGIRELPDAAVEDACRFMQTDSVTWISVAGIHDPRIISSIGDAFQLHPLIQEDIVNTEQRPKLEDHDDYLFIAAKMATIAAGGITEEQISMVVGNRYVICFQETAGELFDPLRERIRKSKGRLRNSGADYLAYALLDMVVDHYYGVLEELGEVVEDLQERVITEPTAELLSDIQNCRHQTVHLRKILWSLRDVVNGLLKSGSEFVSEGVGIYLRDVHDHSLQVAESLETYRDLLAGIFDIYLSRVSHKMNQVMKVLTIIATLFIPMTFLAGIYGMNFKYMPELEWRFAYPVFWLVVLALCGSMMVLFKRKNWL